LPASVGFATYAERGFARGESFGYDGRMTKIQAVIFDMDGLLVDSEPYWDRVRAEMARAAGKDWNGDDHKMTMGVSTREWSEYMIRRLDLKMTPDGVAAHVVGRMQELYTRAIPYKPGAVEAVMLAAAHYPVGLASGSERTLIDRVTNDPPMQGKFRAIVCTDGMPHGKPAPDVYLEAARQIGFRPEQCVCLEDSKNGILSGKSAGLDVIAVPDARFPPPADVLRQASIVLNTLLEFSLDVIHSLR
jgi:HAD superfamily hydrolase (TIGR01509 family)